MHYTGYDRFAFLSYDSTYVCESFEGQLGIKYVCLFAFYLRCQNLHNETRALNVLDAK